MHIQISRSEVPPERRDEYIESRREGQEISRTQDGCLEYFVAADPIVPSHVHFIALWESHEAHEAHIAANQRLNAGRPRNENPVPTTNNVNYIYEVSGRTWEPGPAGNPEPAGAASYPGDEEAAAIMAKLRAARSSAH